MPPFRFVAGFALACLIAAHAVSQTLRHLPEADRAIRESGFAGAVFVADPSSEQLWASDPAWFDRSFLPASTFKIFSALAALEAGAVLSPNALLPWDGIVRGRPEINRDLTLRDAFQVSAVPHFQSLVRAVGRDRMQSFVDRVPYGNQDLSGALEQSWLTGRLRITPAQQLAFLQQLHAGELPFSDSSQQWVRDIMTVERDDRYVLRAKTGWAVVDGNQNTGWWVGWLEADRTTLFFATVLQASDPAPGFGDARIQITRTALAQLSELPQLVRP